MKGNRKFVEGKKAVSAVIGVILMVAITVAIAATVYVYVSGMISGPGQQTPAIQFVVDSTNDKITVSTSDTGVAWADISIKTDDASATINASAVGTTWTTVNNSLINNGATAEIAAGDEFVIAGTTGSVVVTLRYNPTNSLIGSWTVNV